MCFSKNIRFFSGFAFSAILWAVVFFGVDSSAQTEFEELRGNYRLIYDSTYIWPDGRGGYEYVRKFISEVKLAEKGRDILSRPATPVIDKSDEIEIEAYTLLPSGEKFTVEPSDIITRNYTDESRRIFVNFRQPEPGALLHLEWRLKSDKANTAGRRFLGRTIEVDSSIIVITAPETWVFNFAVNPEYAVAQSKTTQRNSTGIPSVNYSWVATDLGGLKLEEYSPPVSRIIPTLYFSLLLDVSWSDPESLSVSWDRIANIYFSQLTQYLSRNSTLSPISDSLQRISSDTSQAIGAAFDWVRTNFRSLTSEIALGGGLDESLERRRGTQAEASAILYAILREMGISCELYLAASRQMGDPLQELPALFWFDRLLLVCPVDSRGIWLEPYYPVSEMGILPFEDQNITVLRLDQPTGEFEHTPDIDYHENGKAIHLKLDIDSLGTLHGEATEIYTGAMIPEISSYLTGLDEGQKRMPWEMKLAKSFPGVKLTGFAAIPPDSIGEAYRIGYIFETGPIIRPFATRAYIPMDLLGRWEDLPDLPQGERRFPIELRRSRFEFERITLNISPAFEVEFTPKNYSLDSFIGEIYSVARRGENSVTITRGFGLKKPTLPVSSYKSVVRFFNSARTEADKQIILARKN